MVGIGLNILLGLTGQVSLGHGGFYAIGAYTCAIITTTVGTSFWLAMPVAGIVSGLVGTALAIPALRVRGPYLAMVTVAFSFIIEHSAVEWKTLTGGANGLMNIPTPSIFGYVFNERAVGLLVVFVTAAMIFLFSRLSRSPWGLAMRAIRDSEVAGQSLGLNAVAIRTMAFTLSAVAAGLAGALFSPLTNFISPGSFSFYQSIMFLLVVIIGGSGTVFGPLIGSTIVVLLPEFLSSLAEYRLLFFGALLLVVLRLAPEGVVGAVAKWFRRSELQSVRGVSIDVPAFLSQGATNQELKIQKLGISFGGIQAVKSFELTAHPCNVTSIIGPNGAGKTTVLNLICGFYKPDLGSVVLGERNVAGLPSYLIARAGIARTFQTTQLFQNMSVLDNQLIALRRGKLGSLFSSISRGRNEDNPRQIAESLLAFVGYHGPLYRPVSELAHVDKRLVEIARALATQPQVLSLDEPAAGLCNQDTEQLIPLLRRIADAGVTVILVEHVMNLVMSVSDQIIVLDAGSGIATGTPTEVRNNPAVIKAYLGEASLAGCYRPEPWGGIQDSVLVSNQLSAGYGAAPVLEGVTLTVHSGQVIAILGANGAGKTTLMRTLSGLHKPVSGTVMLLGKNIISLGAHRIAGEGLVLVPEGRQVFPELTVLDNIKLGAYSRKDFDPEKEVEEMLTRFPALRPRLHNRAGLLSGGEQQMLAIARGLIAKPKILLLDEPSLGLAPTLINELFSALAELRNEGMTILLVDQMAASALSVADRGYVLDCGRVVHEGSAEELRNNPALEQAYLGKCDKPKQA
jgi:ABC-type branched-subunit amino acid transport system ATPase component/ABC-type branched-subunit amino acid transport system permease subunit